MGLGTRIHFYGLKERGRLVTTTPTTMHAAIALSPGNKAKLDFPGGSFIVVQERRRMVFRWWVVEEDGSVIENQRKGKSFMEHLKNHGVDPYEKVWTPV
jgi:hypothetical protein